MDLEYAKARYAKAIFEHNHWGKDDGRTLVIASQHQPKLAQALKFTGEDGRFQTVEEVDVKDLLELGRVVIEKSALDQVLSEHQSDLVNRRSVA